MTDNGKAYWNSIYAGAQKQAPRYDGWLKRYLPFLQTAGVIVDLGCGSGADTIALSALGLGTVACDFSASALQRLQARLPAAKTACFNMAGRFPFADAGIGAVIADLSLHYFDSRATQRIAGEIHRVLKPEGMLLCRVNALKEYTPRDGDRKLDENYYFTDGCARRYFDPPAILRDFHLFSISNLCEYAANKYGKPKHVIEFAAAPRAK